MTRTSAADAVAPGANRLILHPALRETIEALRTAGVRLPRDSTEVLDVDALITKSESKVWPVEPLKIVDVDAVKGRGVWESGLPLFAYDESICNYSALEGTANFTAHALVNANTDRYLPAVLVSSYFYTSSRELANSSPVLRLTTEMGIARQKDYVADKINFIRENVPEGSLLLIDGPIIAGDVYTTFLGFIEELHQADILPVFVVKNSESRLMIDAVPGWKDRYNSDFHWGFRQLRPGQRGPLFGYQDLVNPRNSKVFSYLRSLNVGPLRVEFHSSTFDRYQNQIRSLMDLIHFLVIAQGDASNPQPRPVAIAEKYAREAMKILDVHSMIRKANLAPTMNQTRFGG